MGGDRRGQGLGGIAVAAAPQLGHYEDVVALAEKLPNHGLQARNVRKAHHRHKHGWWSNEGGEERALIMASSGFILLLMISIWLTSMRCTLWGLANPVVT
jgi:hypothetical protein